METQGSREMAGQSGWLTLVKLFAGAFVALMIVGYVAGYKGTKRATLASVYSELQIAPLTDTTAALVHVCRDQITHRYDIDRGEVEISIDVLRRESQGLTFSSFLSPGKHEEVLVALVGGASGGITIGGIAGAAKTAEQSIAEKQHAISRIVAVVVGLSSGYFVGYWLGYTEHARCDDDEKIALLSDKDFWSRAGSVFVPLWLVDHQIDDRRLLSSVGREATFIRNDRFDPTHYCVSPELTAARSLWDKVESQSEVTGADLMALYLYGKMLERARRRDHPDHFVNCVDQLEHDLDELNSFAMIHDPNGRAIDQSEIEKVGIELPESCKSLTGRASNLVKEEYSDLRASAWMKQACAVELSKEVPGSYQSWLRIDKNPVREVDFLQARNACYKRLYNGLDPILTWPEFKSCMRSRGWYSN